MARTVPRTTATMMAGPSLDPEQRVNIDEPADLFTAGFLWPVAVIIEPTLRRNSATMAAFCARHGMALAPPGKTTMTPALFELQLADGAWAITAATVWQARLMQAAAVPRVLIANEVVSE